jgi:hypothetical protein
MHGLGSLGIGPAIDQAVIVLVIVGAVIGATLIAAVWEWIGRK